MSYEVANQDIKSTTKNVKSSEEAMEGVKEMKKIIASNKYTILWLPYQQVQIFARFKLKEIFMNMLNQFGIYDAINTINEIIVAALKIYEKRKII